MNKKTLLTLGLIVIFVLLISVTVFLVLKLEIWDKNTDNLALLNQDDTMQDNGDNETNTDGNVNNETDVTTPKTYAIVISGESNDAQHYAWFRDSSQQAYKLLIQNGYKEENIYYLFEGSNEPNVDYESTLGNLEKVVLEISNKSTDKDTLLFIFIGHGGFDGTHSSYALADTNIRDDKLAAMFSILKRDKLIIVFSPCNTGGFVDDLSSPNTIFISSTKPNESNRAAFIEPFLSSFDGSGDINKDGKVSFEEAFNFASKSVKDQYVNNHWGTLTEHSQLDDNGDGISHEAPMPNGQDGALAEQTFLR